MNIGLGLICTGKYDYFLQPLIDSLDAHFFKDDNVIIYLFWDKPTYRLTIPARFSIVCTPTEHEPWPFPTLFRYKKFSSIEEKIFTSFFFYLDVDMLLVGDVGREILPTEPVVDGGLVATAHPGFWLGGGGWSNAAHSKSYVDEHRRTRYVAGGFQGGETKSYLAACKEMAENIDYDYSIGVIATWHDEEHWNCYLSTRNYKLLTPEYCMIQETEPREKYGIAHFKERILALKKDHAEMRK